MTHIKAVNDKRQWGYGSIGPLGPPEADTRRNTTSTKKNAEERGASLTNHRDSNSREIRTQRLR